MRIDPDSRANWAALLAGVQRELLGAHFLLLDRLLRKSARADYAELEPNNVIERRILLALLWAEEGRVSELAALLCSDVGQVSRALTAMRKGGFVERERQRDPYSLTGKGAALGKALDEVARHREEELTAGLRMLEMFDLAGILANLLNKASAILVEETARARGDAEEEQEQGVWAGLPGRLQPAIVNLSTTIARSATHSFKRLTGISNYEWRILANVASRPGVSFMDLVGHIGSDKAQVSRALDSLVTAGLLERGKAAAAEPVRFAMSEEGSRVHEIMREDALRRNAILIAGLDKGQRRRLQAYLDLLVVNASAMAERASPAQGEQESLEA